MMGKFLVPVLALAGAGYAVLTVAAGSKPPRFVLFASGFLEHGYRRFIERRLREEFGFEGTPIHISVRVREKRGAQQKKK